MLLPKKLCFLPLLRLWRILPPGVLSASLTYPLEVARRRMMAGAPHPNVAAALATIAQTEGPGALFNGVLLSAVIKQAPQMAITFATYEVGSLLGDPTVHFAWLLCQGHLHTRARRRSNRGQLSRNALICTLLVPH